MIFVDTSFWMAAVYPNDRRHKEALELLRSRGGTPLTTSNHVRGETWTLVNRRLGRAAAIRFLDRLAQTPRISVAFVDQELELAAWRWLRRRDEREYSFVDATSFALMRSLKIREALAFDGDFTTAGFVELRAS